MSAERWMPSDEQRDAMADACRRFFDEHPADPVEIEVGPIVRTDTDAGQRALWWPHTN